MTDRSTGEVRLQALGPVRILIDGEPVSALEPRLRNLAVLAVVAVEHEISKETLAAYLWGDRSPDRARHSLSEALYELRKHLGAEWYDPSGANLRATERLTSDVTDFRDSIARGDMAAALNTYSSHFLQQVVLGINDFDEWTDRTARDLFGMYRRAAAEVICTAKEADDLPNALVQARDWAALKPDDDEAVHLLLAVLALSGDRTQALDYYSAYAALLDRDRLSPLDRTVALVQAIRDADLDRIESLFELSESGTGEAETRATNLLWPKATLGSRIVLIQHPDSIDGDIIPLSGAVTSVGHDGEISVGDEPASGACAVLRRDAGRTILTAADDEVVYLHIEGRRSLRPGDVVRIGQQQFTLLDER